MLPNLKDESVVTKARLEPGKMFLVDLEAGRIVPDDTVKEKYATRLPYADWLKKNLINLKDWTEHSQSNGAKVSRVRSLDCVVIVGVETLVPRGCDVAFVAAVFQW